MERYYIICVDVESAWRKVCFNFFGQTTTTKYFLDFTDKQFIFVTKDNVDMIKILSDPCCLYKCYNPTYYSYSEENVDRMIDWIKNKIIKGIYEMEEKVYMTKSTLTAIATWTVPVIKKVIFNNPATIVMWKDGTKTVVKAEGEDYDPEKGLAMAIAKKAYGNQGNYYNEFKKWLPKES